MMSSLRTKPTTDGLLVGQKAYTSLPAQQKRIERGLIGDRESSIDVKQRAEGILNQRLEHHQVMPRDVRGGSVARQAKGAVQLNSKSTTGQKRSQQNAPSGKVRQIFRPVSQANAGALAGKKTGTDSNFKILPLQHLDRKEDSPDKVYGQSPSIENSPYKHQYDKIHQQLLGEADGPYTAANDKAYGIGDDAVYSKDQRHRQKAGTRMPATSFLEYSRLEPMSEIEWFQSSQPKILGQGPLAKEIHQKWINTDFPDRNLALKKKHLKSIATEESLDDWYAQSLGIPYDKFLKQKRMLSQIMNDAKRKKQPNKSDQQSVITKTKRSKRISIDQNPDIPYDEAFAKAEEPIEKSLNERRPKTSQMPTKVKVTSQFGAPIKLPDFNQMIKNARGSNNYIIQDPGELQPCVYSAFGTVKSEALQADEPSPRASKLRRGAKPQTPALDGEQALNLKTNNSMTSMTQYAALAQRSKSVTQPQTGTNIERRALLNEIGGFNSKKLLDTYFQQMKDREKVQKSMPKKQGQNQEFLQTQKKKLRQLMLQNADIEHKDVRKQRRSIDISNGQFRKRPVQKKDDKMSFGSWNIQSEDVKADYIQNKAGAEFKQKRDHGQQPSQFGGSQFDRSGGIKSGEYEYGAQSIMNNKLSTEEQSITSSKFQSKANSMVPSRISAGFHPTSHPSTGKMTAYQGRSIDNDAQSIKIRTGNSPAAQLGRKDGEEEDKQLNTSQFDKQSLKRFWVTDQQALLDKQERTEFMMSGEPSMRNDQSHTWYLQDKRLGEQQLVNHIPGYQKDTIGQALDDVSNLPSMQNGNAALSTNENAFLSMNKSLKGMEMSSQYHKYIARVMQEKYFNNQKKETIDQMFGKKALRWTQNRPALNNSTSKKGSTSTLQPEAEATSNSNRQGRNMGTDQQRHQFVLKQIELDNVRDIEDPFVVLNVDKRVNKINKKPLVAKPDEKLRNMKHDFQDSEFWFLKGYDHAEQNEMDSAIDSYRQAIRLNTDHAEAMMNLAAQYEAQQRYAVAVKWYNLSIQLHPDRLDAYYGYALCQFKDGNPQDAAERLSVAIEALNEEDIKDRSKRHKIYFRYLRALCYKVVGEFVKSQKDYKDILRAFELEEGSKFAKYIFAMILMPIETNRKKLLEYVEGFKGILDLFEGKKNRRILSHHYLEYIDKNHVYIGDNQNKKWLDKKMPDIIRILRKRSFFKRFSLPRICEMLEQMELRLVKERDILFFEKDKVYVIISGNILMKNHDMQIQLPLTCAKFGEGDILNFLQENSLLFNSLETWFFAQVESEVAVFDRNYFEKVWDEDIMTEKLMLQSSLTASQPLFNKLSKLTIMMLVSEVFQYKKFSKGDIILDQSKYSPTNTHFRQYYEIRLSKFAEELRAKRTKADLNTAMARSPVKLKDSSQAVQVVVEKPQAKAYKEIHKDMEDIEKFGKVAQKFNFKSRKKANLLKELGVQGQDNAPEDARSSQNEDDMDSTQDMRQNGRLAGANSVSKNSLNDFSKDEPEGKRNGLYFITRGYCVVRNHDDGYCSKTLKQGDFFGESDLLKCIGYQFFGEIAADSDDVECWYIPSDQFWKIPIFEQVHMKELSLKRRDILMLSFEYSRRYKVDMKEYASYYA